MPEVRSKSDAEGALLALAECHGIEPGYHDIWGTWHPLTVHTAKTIRYSSLLHQRMILKSLFQFMCKMQGRGPGPQLPAGDLVVELPVDRCHEARCFVLPSASDP